MLFNSYIFIFVFLPVSLILYFFFSSRKMHKTALIVLILMSLWFYGYFNVSYLWILCGSILGNWILSRGMIKSEGKKRKILLVSGLVCDIALIFIFKYYDFFILNVNQAFHTSFELRHLILPLGISFFTFQQISYLVDTYRGETEGYHFLEYTAFVSFFPQLIAGPIVLHDELIPQFRDEKKWTFSQDSFAHGIYIFAVGLFKKVIVADTFGTAVSWAWTNLNAINSMEMIIVSICYTFQLYFDFSAYSDMAIGIGKMFHLELPINFNSPYKATSIIEFWDRWHMTLTRFLRKYIYFPLGGSRKGKIRTYVNIFIVFIVSGIWHGANWTFILWGMLHGVADILNRFFKKTWDKCNRVIAWMVTFIFVNSAWIVFRSDNVGQAFELLRKCVQFDGFAISANLYNNFYLQEIGIFVEHIGPLAHIWAAIPGLNMWIFIIAAFAGCLCLKNVHEKVFVPNVKNAILTIVLLVWSIISFSGISEFLYFNF